MYRCLYMLQKILSRSSLRTAIALPLLIISVYGPFMGSRFIRTAGDEKVYVSQALEMERGGRWFVQTLQDEPNYYKGPVHYLLLRVGMLILGRTPWATLYMNLGFMILGALALAAVARRRFPQWADTGGDLWIGTAFAFGVGIYAHSFASQMEVELASLFAIGVYLLDQLKRDDAGWLFWVLAGTLGLIKSPLHSAFLGTSALLYWSLNGELKARLKNPYAWLAVFLGISVSIIGYLPAYFLDRDNFWNAYVIRETLRKSDGSGQDWSVAVLSTFGFYLFPWLFVALVAYAQTIFNARELCKNPETRNSLLLAFSIFLPSTLFFIWHIYRFENYNLPVIAGVWLWIATLWQYGRSKPGAWAKAYQLAIQATGILFFLLPVSLSVLAYHFAPLPQWWPSWLLPTVWVGSLFSACGFLFYRTPLKLAIASCGYLWAFGALFTVIGEREMVDLKAYIARTQKTNHPVALGYYNLNRNIWSEWGFLNFWVNHEVHGIHTPEALKAAMLAGETILVSAKEDGIRDFHDYAAKNFPNLPLKVTTWKRWRTQGKSDSGEPLWRAAWTKRDLSLLEVDYLIVETK